MFTYTLTLYGDTFNPKNIDFFSDLNVNTCCEPTSLKKDGSHCEYGYLCINGESIVELALIAKKILKTFREDIESVEVDVMYFYDNQCNLEFSNEEIKLIHDIGACLNVSCDKNS